MDRGTSLLWGPALGAQALRRADVLAADDPAAVLAAVDDIWPRLQDDERVLFLLGYEASVALDPRLPRHPADARLGPGCFAWRCIASALPPLDPRAPAPRLVLTTTTEARAAHLARVARCQEHLVDGVLYQANLAHRVAVAPADHAAGLRFFLARAQGPACAALVDIDGFGSLVSLSPERFVDADLRRREARTFPIKGTVPRGVTPVDDERQRVRLCTSEKDRAEHVMIVDLLRNDLGRVAVAGGVTVERLLDVLPTPAVHHLESTVHARLRDDVGVADLLRACAPGGSITGAPKSAAVEVIADLEDGPRGPYTGVLGVVDGAGRLRSALLIRTWIRPDAGPGALHVGGGVVVDSDPEREWEETLDKARAFGDVQIR